MEATLPFCQASLILVTIRCIASVVVLPGLPPNCVGGRRLCFSTRKEMSAAISVEKSLPIVSKSLMG